MMLPQACLRVRVRVKGDPGVTTRVAGNGRGSRKAEESN